MLRELALPHASRQTATAPWQPAIIAWVLSVQAQARIKDALRGRSIIHLARTLADARQQLATLNDVTMVIVPSSDCCGQSPLPLVREIVSRFPNIAIVAHCRAGIEHSAEIRALAVAGVHEFLFEGIDDAGVALRAVLDAATRECTGDAVARQLLPLVPQRLHNFVECCLHHPQQATSVARVASLLHVDRRTLCNRCAHEMMPHPAELVMWCRLMLAARLLERSGRTVESVALELEFPSDTSFRNAMKRYTGMRAGEVRTSGGLTCVLAAFLNRTLLARSYQVAV